MLVVIVVIPASASYTRVLTLADGPILNTTWFSKISGSPDVFAIAISFLEGIEEIL